jgi:hypothetical protein
MKVFDTLLEFLQPTPRTEEQEHNNNGTDNKQEFHARLPDEISAPDYCMRMA